ncbi:MAG: carboxypeptidase-like regulatory domain-containing protein, partial [Candidatus Marinimicrobia bacterium]|nr:carboxypeptidase-like regulatory domain-containing protein [Candidatus Neomarinimicrobiota bacterium]
MMFRQSKILLILFVMVLIPLTLCAAGGKISGMIYDRGTNEPLVAANIMITEKWDNDAAVKLEHITGSFSDKDGYFVILNVAPGTYTLKVTMMGYANFTMEKVRVNMDRTIQLNFAMTQETLTMDAVTVVAEKEVIKADLASSLEIIGKDRIEDAPVM